MEVASDRTVVKSSDDADNVFAKPAFKATKPKARKSPSSFDRNMQKLLLETQTKTASPAPGSTAMEVSSGLAEETYDESARQLRRLNDILQEVVRMQQTILSSRKDQAVLMKTLVDVDVNTEAIMGTVEEIEEASETTANEVSQMHWTIEGINTQTDTIEGIVGEIKDDLQETSGTVDGIRDTVNEVKDELEGVSSNALNACDFAYETKNAVAELKEDFDTALCKIDTTQETLEESMRNDMQDFRVLRNRMDAMDDKLDILIEMVRDANSY